MKDSLSSERRKSEQLKTDKSALQKELAETQLDSEKLAIKLRDEMQQQNKKIEELEVCTYICVWGPVIFVRFFPYYT